MSGVIRTDYVSGQDYKAEDHNAENLAILESQEGAYSRYFEREYTYLYKSRNVCVDTTKVLAVWDNYYKILKVEDFEKEKYFEIDCYNDHDLFYGYLGTVQKGEYIYAFGYGKTGDANQRRILQINRETEAVVELTADFLPNFSASYQPFDIDDAGNFYFSKLQQNDLQFGDSTSRFDITEPTTGTFRYTWNGTGTDPNFLTSGVSVGNYLKIEGANARNNGSLIVSAVTDDYIEVSNPETILYQADLSSDASYLSEWNDGTAHQWDSAYGGNIQKHSTSNTSMFTKPEYYIEYTPGVYEVSCDIQETSGSGNLNFYLFGSNSPNASTGYTGTYSYQKTMTTSGTNAFGFGNNQALWKANNYKAKRLSGIAETNVPATFKIVKDAVVARATLSGSTLTKQEDLFFTSSSVEGNFDCMAVFDDTIFARDISSPYKILKFNKLTQAFIDSPSAIAKFANMSRLGDKIAQYQYSQMIIPAKTTL